MRSWTGYGGTPNRGTDGDGTTIARERSGGYRLTADPFIATGLRNLRKHGPAGPA
ncbi:hypothetical protein [Streptomyces sp. NPDC058155]|uniref:hypothetical protein n=1 Tax=Streptomyces sp. NPDC058155 TaxID=3346359 RepID=UPI0036EF7850